MIVKREKDEREDCKDSAVIIKLPKVCNEQADLYSPNVPTASGTSVLCQFVEASRRKIA
jgi:hypothetical protein